MKIKSTLWNLVPFIVLGLIVLESSLGGGAFYFLKTGQQLTGKFWDHVPAISLAFVLPICVTLILFKVISDPLMPKRMKATEIIISIYFGFNWVNVLTVTSLSRIAGDESIIATIQSYFPDSWEAAMIILYWGIFSTLIIVPGGMLAAMGYDETTAALEKKHARATEDEKEAALSKKKQLQNLGIHGTRIKEFLEQNMAEVYTIDAISIALDLNRSIVTTELDNLESAGEVYSIRKNRPYRFGIDVD